MIKVAINGFGRIGRLAFREMITSPDYDVVAINDLGDAESLAYLLKYDTNHRSFHEELIAFEGDQLVINKQKRIKVYSEKDPLNLPWKNLMVDVVLECTGVFTDEEGAQKHITAGAQKVVISAPGKGSMKTIVYGVNDNTLDGSEKIISTASCTTNCLAPVLKIIEDNIGIVKGFMTTIHAYTNDQMTLDIYHKKGINSRRGRAAAMNIIPSSTGAATAIGEVIPQLKGKFDGGAFRVPVSDGSVIDLTIEPKRKTSIEEINNLFINNQSEVIKATNDPVVSSDILGKKCGALVDLQLTSVIEDDNSQLIKITAWYDNEMGYTAQMMRTVRKIMSK
ncbi:MAG TPA: type I glyceraldehyde-3-phosphate dehydrogenase [Bacilli bacterium]|nr:type I glyceraldehyde-3-phosphate dehydrogenase [Bacilli bacterium]